MYERLAYLDLRCEAHGARPEPRPAAGDARPPGAQDAVVGAGPRLRHRAMDRAVDGGRAHRRRGLAVPGSAPPRGARVDLLRVEALGAQPPREVLPAHGARAPTAAR